MASIGSVFLGDSKRIRVLSSSTPPSSPPPTSPSGVSIMSGMMSGMSSPHSPPPPSASPQPPRITSPIPNPPPPIAPELSLELRLRWLEAIVYGVKQNNGKGKGKLASDQTLLRAADGLQRKLDAAVQGNDGLKRFMSQCTRFFYRRLLISRTKYSVQMTSTPISSRPRLHWLGSCQTRRCITTCPTKHWTR